MSDSGVMPTTGCVPAQTQHLWEELAAARRRIAELEAELDEAKATVWRQVEANLDPPVCRLQFPDGSVPGNVCEAAEGWKKWADEFERRAKQHEWGGS